MDATKGRSAVVVWLFRCQKVLAHHETWYIYRFVPNVSCSVYIHQFISERHLALINFTIVV